MNIPKDVLNTLYFPSEDPEKKFIKKEFVDAENTRAREFRVLILDIADLKRYIAFRKKDLKTRDENGNAFPKSIIKVEVGDDFAGNDLVRVMTWTDQQQFRSVINFLRTFNMRPIHKKEDPKFFQSLVNKVERPFFPQEEEEEGLMLEGEGLGEDHFKKFEKLNFEESVFTVHTKVLEQKLEGREKRIESLQKEILSKDLRMSTLEKENKALKRIAALEEDTFIGRRNIIKEDETDLQIEENKTLSPQEELLLQYRLKIKEQDSQIAIFKKDFECLLVMKSWHTLVQEHNKEIEELDWVILTLKKDLDCLLKMVNYLAQETVVKFRNNSAKDKERVISMEIEQSSKQNREFWQERLEEVTKRIATIYEQKRRRRESLLGLNHSYNIIVLPSFP